MYGSYHRRQRRKPMGEINVVPFIDVMLVLLVIFMITAPMLNQGVNVELPQVTSEPIDTDEREPLIVSVDREGQYYISLGDEETPVALDKLGEQVTAMLSRRPDTPVMVRGDRNVSYGQVVTLMSTLQGAGVGNVGLISEPPSSEQ
ncbi:MULTISPECIES: protein TolR [Chromohalobacter]|jgi:biopolymer transport protein TolR|uniref:Tol-Pal system protein TolR n=1 Tax=Chromohalobacter israelensis (strain ATCC BAA-138 / DSM 3043 / CIP 106854 / NCIMB 13768 / 1H11) TaxID=290398 RepID=Q1QWF5_CHRI1|nr:MULTISPECIES: protein TolR [Chromohalobacter]ABE59203.1 Cell division and transport-associated protein TolR [Chromohalobacter salexigens DSM 3043]MBZ5877654.1 protein TolR [Chromohalobacter salexigens]MDF9435523.1 protein TolR [Chromohalobacter israelensis]MDO0946675.1 protein TolR [Chromohalobacter salexigens]NQY46828.1 protein TolR [Chromohalobacter sp.]